VRLKVQLVNRGDADTGRVKVCARGPERFVRIGKCAKVASVAAGERKRARINVALKHQVPADLRVTIKSAGLPTEKRKVLLLPR
jgi:hypothetical protein